MPRRIAVMLPNWIGDVAMATPALRALRKGLPDAQLIGVMRPYVREVLAGTSWLDEQLLYQRRGADPDLHVSQLLRRLRARAPDEFLLLTNSFSTAWIAWRSRASRRIGFVRHFRRWLLTDPLPMPRRQGRLVPRSAVDHYLDVVAVLGCRGSRQLELATTAADEQAADAVWQQHQLVGSKVVTLSTGGAYGAAKRWPDRHFAELARRLVDADPELRVLVVCGPAERESAAAIAEAAARSQVTSLAGESPRIGLTKSCIRRSRLVVANDSGPRHLAAAFRVPTVALFGSTDPRLSDNYHPFEQQLRMAVDCAPCAQRTCPLQHHRCMNDLLPAQVAATVLRMLHAATDQRVA